MTPYSYFQISRSPQLHTLDHWIDGKWALQDNRAAKVVAWFSDRETASSACELLNKSVTSPQP